MSYSDQLRDPRWQKKRLCVMQRDDFTCRDCGDSKSTLNVHHCFYAKGGPWNTPSELLLTLCEPCHLQRGETEDSVKLILAEVFVSTPQIAISALLENQGPCAMDGWRQEALAWVKICKNKTKDKLVAEWFVRMRKSEGMQ